MAEELIDHVHMRRVDGAGSVGCGSGRILRLQRLTGHGPAGCHALSDLDALAGNAGVDEQQPRQA
jgi:hypothetical protein